MRRAQLPVSVTAYFSRLARDLQVSAALPHRDGCLLLQVRKGAPPARLWWSPFDRPGAICHPDLDGVFVAEGLAVDEPALLLQRLAIVWRRRRIHAGFDPLAWRTTGSGPIRLAAGFCAAYLQPYFQAHRTEWGPFRFDGDHAADDGGVHLTFNAPDARVVFALHPVTSAAAAGWISAGPLALHTVCDTRSAKHRRGQTAWLDSYLVYALQRAFESTRPVAAVQSSAVRAPAPVDSVPLPLPAANTTQSAEAADIAVRRRIEENLDETPSDGFFLEAFAREVGCDQTVATVLDADDGVAPIFHIVRECTNKLCWIGSTRHFRPMYGRFTPLPTAMPLKPVRMVEATQLDTIFGTDGPLREALRQACADERTKVVVVIGTCVGDYTGLDVAGLLAEHQPGQVRPVILVRLAIEDFTRIDEVWATLLKVARTDVDPLPGAVNLLGFAPADAPVVREWTEHFEQLGLRINAVLVPSFRTDAALRFLAAPCSIVNLADLAQFELAQVRTAFAKMRFVDVAPPFGPQATHNFYEAVQAAGSGSADPVVVRHTIAALWQPYEESWRKWQERAARHTVGLLVRPCDVVWLTEPHRLHGLCLVPVLLEMGFRVHLVALQGDRPGEAERSADRLRSHFPAAAGKNAALTVEVAAPRSSLLEWLRQLPVSLVYSEYPPDQRVLAAGKLSFAPQDFEMGYAGALRTVARLTRLAESRFHRVWPAVLAGAPRP